MYIFQDLGSTVNVHKGASFKENHPMTTAGDALRTTFIFRFRTLTNNLNFLTNQNTYKMTCDSKINVLYIILLFA